MEGVAGKKNTNNTQNKDAKIKNLIMEIYYKDVAPLVTPSYACPISRMTLLEEAT